MISKQNFIERDQQQHGESMSILRFYNVCDMSLFQRNNNQT